MLLGRKYRAVTLVSEQRRIYKMRERCTEDIQRIYRGYAEDIQRIYKMRERYAEDMQDERKIVNVK